MGETTLKGTNILPHNGPVTMTIILNSGGSALPFRGADSGSK